jgi:hypothetical protein
LLADFAAGGLLAAFGILAALHRRGKNGSKIFKNILNYSKILLFLHYF